MSVCMHRLLTSALQHFHLQNKTQNGSRAADGPGSSSALTRSFVSWDKNGTFLAIFFLPLEYKDFFFLTTAFFNVTAFQRPCWFTARQELGRGSCFLHRSVFSSAGCSHRSPAVIMQAMGTGWECSMTPWELPEGKQVRGRAVQLPALTVPSQQQLYRSTLHFPRRGPQGSTLCFARDAGSCFPVRELLPAGPIPAPPSVGPQPLPGLLLL